MAAGAGDHLMLSRLGLGEEQAETAGSSTVLVHENVVRSFYAAPAHSFSGVLANLESADTAAASSLLLS